MKIVNLTIICILALFCCITFVQSRRSTPPRTSVKTTKTSVMMSTTSKRPSTSTRVVTTTKRTTALRTTTITTTSVHSTDVLNTSSSPEATTGLKAGTVAGIVVAITAVTAVVVFIFLLIRRSRNRKHHEYKQSSSNFNLKNAYSTTSMNVDDGATYFQLEHQAGGGANTFSSASSQVKDTDLSSATAPDAAVYCNVHQHNNIESHSIPTPSDFPDDHNGLRHEDVGAKDVLSPSAVDVIYGNLQNNDSDVAFVNNYDHLQSDDPVEYNRLCRPRQDEDTQCTILRLPDTYDHLQNSSITNTAPVCTGHDPEN